MLLVRHRTAMILSLQGTFSRQTGRTFSWKAMSKLDAEAFPDLLGADELLLFTVGQQGDTVRFLDQKISLLEKKILESAKLKPEFERLLTLPGVGKILGLTIMYETGNIGRFARAGNYTSYCRCASATRRSNDKKKGENNRRNGNAYLCWAYVEAVHHALRCCPPARSFYDRKKAKKNGAVATKALASKWTKAAYHVITRASPTTQYTASAINPNVMCPPRGQRTEVRGQSLPRGLDRSFHGVPDLRGQRSGTSAVSVS
jgi:transposase